MKLIFFCATIFIIVGKSGPVRAEENRVVNFEMNRILACEKQTEVTDCLQGIVGKDIGFTLRDKKLISVNFPKLKGGTLIVNGTKFKSVFDPSIKFDRSIKSYSVCGGQLGIEIRNYKITGMLNCICGFDSNGGFNLQLEEKYSFIPRALKVSVNIASCNGDMKTLYAGSVTLLEKAKFCDYDFPKETEFYILESYPAFEAPKNGVIDGKGGNQISVVKGKKYMSDSSTETPCNWEPVPDHVGSE